MAPTRNEPVITVDGDGIEIGDALPETVRGGVHRIAGKYFGRLSGAAAYFSRQSYLHRCRLNIQMGGLAPITAEGEAKDAHRAFAVALEKAGKQLRRMKRRLVDHRPQAALPEPGAA